MRSEHLGLLSIVWMVGLVQCTYVTGKTRRDDGGGSGGLGGAGSDEHGDGGKPSNPDGGAPNDEGSGGRDDGEQGGTGGTQEGSGGASDGSGGDETGTGGDSGGNGSGGENGSGGAPTIRPAHLVVMTATQAFVHSSTSHGLSAINDIATDEGVSLTLTQDKTFFTDANLAQVGAVVFLNTSGNILDEAQELAFENFISSGGGFIGIHSAADTERDWPFYKDLLGALVTDHPANALAASIDVEVSNHPATFGLDSPLTRTDEWYNFSDNPRDVPGIQVLLTLDESTYVGGSMGDHPIAWSRTIGESRIFYTGFGHTDTTFQEPEVLDHLRGAILWVLGRL